MSMKAMSTSMSEHIELVLTELWVKAIGALKTQSSWALFVAISHEIFLRNHSNVDTKCQMG